MSTIESKHHPFFGTQWHPEKPPFEFAMDVRTTALPEAYLHIYLRSAGTRGPKGCCQAESHLSSGLACTVASVPTSCASAFACLPDNRPLCSKQTHVHALPRPQAIPHSIDAIKVSQHLGHAFIEAARRSTHRPESEEEELEMQIYNVAPVFTAKDVVMEPSYDGARLLSGSRQGEV